MQPAQIVQALGASHAALSRGDPNQAEQLLRPVLATKSAPAKALYLLGLIRNAQGRAGEAEALMQQALRAAPDDYECWNSLGSLYTRARQVDAAISSFREAIARNGRYAPARFNLANALLSAERAAEAETEARALLALGESAQARALLGAILRQLGQYDAALREFDRALQLAPNNAHARHDRAIALDKLGRGKEAVSEYEALHAGGLRSQVMYRNWAGALLDLGRQDEAEKVLLEATAAFPGDPVLQDNLARLRWVMSGDADFARDFAAAVHAAPDNTHLRIGCADLLRRSGQLDAGAEMIREGLKRAPDDPGLLGALGVLLSERGDLSGAEAAIKRALPARRSDWRFRENLVDVLLRAQKPAEALAHIIEARAARPLDQAWVAQHATALAALGDPEYGRLYDFERMVRPYDLPTPPGFSSTAAFNAALIERLRELHQLKAHPIDQSLVNGTQTSKSLLESNDPLIRAFLRSVELAMAEFVRTMPDQPDHPFWGRKPASGKVKLVGCWSVRLRQGGYHVNHVHPEGWISSAYYAVVPPETRGANDHQGWIQFGEPRWPTPGVQAGHFVEPSPGKLVLFPSYMWHGTVPFTQGEERMTIAMDAVPLG